jgi:hypothetical protein
MPFAYVKVDIKHKIKRNINLNVFPLLENNIIVDNNKIIGITKPINVIPKSILYACEGINIIAKFTETYNAILFFIS